MKRCIFFDLDETLISCKSLFEVFKYYCENTKNEELYYKVTFNMKQMLLNQTDRNLVNYYFYNNFKGISKKELANTANEWFHLKKANPYFFCDAVLDQLKLHQANGDLIIIVSGSFNECVAPIANYLAVHDYLCINLDHENDIYTGNLVGIQTIGDGKKEAIIKYVNDKKLTLEDSYGYGDHISDASFLSLVTHAVIVGDDDPSLMRLAHDNSWTIMPKYIRKT